MRRGLSCVGKPAAHGLWGDCNWLLGVTIQPRRARVVGLLSISSVSLSFSMNSDDTGKIKSKISSENVKWRV